ncbi:MAG: anion permease [Chitinophagaceae bacterium]|nr:anion permease [Chitinophagaceae bacterium]
MGFIIATGFLSMWLSNTATTMMMFPIAMSVIHVITTHNKESTGIKNFSLVLMLSIAYASNFALGTIIGTPPNVAYVNYIHEKFNYTIGFTDWMIVFTPLTIVLLFMLYWVMVRFLFPNKIKHSVEGKSYIKAELNALGKLSVPEKRVLFVFIGTVFLWITKDIINNLQKTIVLDDTIIAMIGAIALFIIPSGNKKKQEKNACSTGPIPEKWPGVFTVIWRWYCTGKGPGRCKTDGPAGHLYRLLRNRQYFLMILIVTTFSIFLSEVMSNVAQVIVMAPVISSVAVALHMDPLLLGIPMTLGASCASMLPMGTPPNAIVFASGHIKMKDMLKAGIVLNIVCIILITLFCWLLQPMIMRLM